MSDRIGVEGGTGSSQLDGGTNLLDRVGQTEMQDARELAIAIGTTSDQLPTEGLPVGREVGGVHRRGEGHRKRLLQEQGDVVAEVFDDLQPLVAARMISDGLLTREEPDAERIGSEGEPVTRVPRALALGCRTGTEYSLVSKRI